MLLLVNPSQVSNTAWSYIAIAGVAVGNLHQATTPNVQLLGTQEERAARQNAAAHGCVGAIVLPPLHELELHSM